MSVTILTWPTYNAASPLPAGGASLSTRWAPILSPVVGDRIGDSAVTPRAQYFALQLKHAEALARSPPRATHYARGRVAAPQVQVRHHSLGTILRHRRSPRRHRLEGPL